MSHHQELLKSALAQWGLISAGIIPVGKIDDSQISHLTLWLEKGMHGDMTYLARNRERLIDSSTLSTTGKTLLLVTFPYETALSTPRPVGFGRVARYARGKDYHKVLPRLMKEVARYLPTLDPELKVSRIFTDAIPLLERAFARQAGLGFIGKNTLLISHLSGSFCFIGGMIIDCDIEPQTFSEKKRSCGSCTRCLTQCPTQAFSSPYVLDARKCISYISIEKRGILSQEEGLSLGEWIFGCDICQEVCPFNHKALKFFQTSIIPDLNSGSGVGEFLNLSTLLSMRTHDEFCLSFSGTPLMRAKREGLLRNAACVASAMKDDSVFASLFDAAINDFSTVVRAHASRALISFYLDGFSFAPSLWNTFLLRAKEDPSDEVKKEFSLL